MSDIQDVMAFALTHAVFLNTADAQLPQLRREQGDEVARQLAEARSWALKEHALIDRTYLPEARGGQHAQIAEQTRQRTTAATVGLLRTLADDEAALVRRLEPDVMQNLDSALRVAYWTEFAAIGDPLLLTEVALESARIDDRAAVAAITSLPSFHRARRNWPSFSEVVVKMREIQMHVQHPDLSATLSAIRQLRGEVERAVASVLRDTGAMADPLAVMIDGNDE